MASEGIVRRLVCDFASSPPDHIDSFHDVEELSLAGCPEWVTDDILIRLSKGGHLRQVQLFRCWRVTDRAIRQLVAINGSTLQIVGLAGCSGITDKSLKAIGRYCHQLTSIDLTRCPNITDLGINYLEAKPLNTLLLYADSQIGSSAYTCISTSMHFLVTLDLCGHANLRSNALVDILRACRHIEVLNLSWCVGLDDKFLGPIAEDGLLGNLKTLSLFGIKNLSLQPLKDLLEYFKSIPSLTQLDVRAIPSAACLTEDDCRDLRETLPQLVSWKLHS